MFSSTPVAPAYSGRTAAAAGLPTVGCALGVPYPEDATSVSAAVVTPAVPVNAPLSASAFSSSSLFSSSSASDAASATTTTAAAAPASAAAARPIGAGSGGHKPPKKTRCRAGHLVHKVKPADTLLSIALQYDVPVPHLMLANKLSSSDIWFVDTIIIPCTSHSRGDTTASPAPVSSLSTSVSPAAGAAAATAPVTAHPQQQQQRQRTQSASSLAPAAAARATKRTPAATACSAASGGSTAAAAAQRQTARNAESTTREATAAEEKSCCVIPESVQQSARIAMLVEALVRQEGIDAKLARSQINHWNGDFRAAACDCREIRRWQQALRVSVHEVLAYLSIHDYDVDKARTAMVEDIRWHQAQISRQEETSREMFSSSRGWFSSFSSLSQLLSPFSSATRYARLPEYTREDERDSSSSFSKHAQSPRVIGKVTSLPSPAATSRSAAAPSVVVQSFSPAAAAAVSSSLPLSFSSAGETGNLFFQGRRRTAAAAARASDARQEEKETTREDIRRRRRQQHTNSTSINVEMSRL